MDDVEENVFNPYNDKNNEITLNHVQCILNKYGVTAKVNNLELYKRAFIHRSYTKKTLIENEKMNITIMPCPNNMISLKSKSNERLEFIGDGVLELITKYYLYRRFPNAEEGFMTEKKIAIVKNEHIGRLAYEMNLHKWFILSKNAEEKKTRTNLKKLGCIHFNLPLKKRSLNPFFEFLTFFKLFKNILIIKPDYLLSFTIKP